MMTNSTTKHNSQAPETLCTHLGRGQDTHSGFVNPPTTRGSTMLYPTIEALMKSRDDMLDPNKTGYGIAGTETTRELEHVLTTLDGAYASMVVSSGLAAITTAIMGFVKSGDHILVIDSLYHPTRFFCDQVLKSFKIETTYYPADIGTDIKHLIKDNTKLIFLEAPSSLTMEVQDLGAMIKVAKKHGLVTILDNTWATSINYPAVQNGINVSIQAGTKYIGGHSDIMMGVISTDEENWMAVREAYLLYGQCVGSEEVSLALRGLRTMPTRLKTHSKHALQIAQWLEARLEVRRVLHPALESNPWHANFIRYFKGSSGLFSFEVKTDNLDAVAAMLDNMQYFGIGASWGGFESLIVPAFPNKFRSAKSWDGTGQLIRVNIGLECIDDLLSDLEKGLERLSAAS